MEKYGIRIKWNTIASFELKFGELTVLSDPCIGMAPGTDATYESVEGCDIITISHVHWDHVTDLPALVKKFDPLVLVGELSATPLLRWMDGNPQKVYPVMPNIDLDFGEVSIRPLFGRHVNFGTTYSEQQANFESRPYLQADPALLDMQVLGSTEYRNYLFTAKGGAKVLLWGNEPTLTQEKIVAPLRPDIAILQFQKARIPELAEFAAAIGCKVLIPHHHDFRYREEEYEPMLNELKEAYLKLVPDGTFISPKHGEWMCL